MKVAVVAAGYANAWREVDVLTRRLAGTLACHVDVDLIVPGNGTTVAQDGAVRILRFLGTPFDPPRREAWRQAVLGVRGTGDLCACDGGSRQQARDLPYLAEEELLFSEGGFSPELYEYLGTAPYDLTVFVGHHSPSTFWGVRALPENRRFALVPAAADDSDLWLRAHDETFERADRFLVCTEGERDRIADRVGADRAGRIENIGFLFGVNAFARKTEPYDFEGGRYLVAVDNWFESRRADQFISWAEELQQRDIGLRLFLVGPGAERHRFGVRLTGSRLDIWRWVCRATGLLEPRRNALLGREVVEAMLFGTPVVAHANGGANREHADRGNGGLWYRTDAEFFGIVATLLNDDIRETLGRQGRTYAEANWGDTDRFVKRIAEALL